MSTTFVLQNILECVKCVKFEVIGKIYQKVSDVSHSESYKNNINHQLY